MKQTWLLLAGIMLVVLTGCQSKKETSTEIEPVSGCRFGVCVQDVYATVDDEFFIVLFDITPPDGLPKLDAAPMFTNPVQILVENNQGERYVDKLFGPDEYYCYAGTDVPWSGGKNTATCGIGNPVGADQKTPAVGEEIRVSLPEFGGFETRVTVIAGW